MIAGRQARLKVESTRQRAIRLCFVACLLWLAPGFCAAGRVGAEIKSAELTLQGDDYVLSADLLYRLSLRAKEALQNGVPLYWNIQIRIRQHRDYWWDKTVVEKTIRYRIQYHALLNMYRVRNDGTGSTDNFSTLSAALDLISKLHDYAVIEKRGIDTENSYYAAMKITFDREALPLPLRPSAYLNSQWYLSSGWYLWSLTK